MNFKKFFLILLCLGMLCDFTFAQDDERSIVSIRKLKTRGKERLYSMELRNIELKDLLRVIAHDYKLNIIMEEAIEDEKVTASFSKITLAQAIEALVEAHGCVLRREDNIIKVSRGFVTRAFFPTYMEATELEKQIEALLSDKGKVSVNKESNSIVVTDFHRNIKRIESCVKGADIEEKQVMIEAKIVEANLNSGMMFGLDWRWLNEKAQPVEEGLNPEGQPYNFPERPEKETLRQASFDFITTEVGDVPYAGTASGLIFKASYKGIDAILQTLASHVKINLLSAPRVIATNNKESSIEFIHKIPYIKKEVTAEEGIVSESSEVQFEEVGIKLKVTPRIREDGKIALYFIAEVSELIQRYMNLPVIARRKTEINVVCESGQAIVIGGLLKDNIRQSVRKTPILGDIPLIGYLFRSTVNMKSKTELVIFISPTIIGKEEMRAMAREERYGVGRRSFLLKEIELMRLKEMEQAEESRLKMEEEIINRQMMAMSVEVEVSTEVEEGVEPVEFTEKVKEIIYFPLRSAGIPKEGFPVLEKIAGELSLLGDYKVEIKGYTDSSGIERLNQKLSEIRAKAIMYYFVVGKRLPRGKFTAEGCGDKEPLAPNTTIDGKIKNRRVEITVYK